MDFNSGIRISLRCKAHTQKNIRIGAPLSLHDLVQNNSVQVVIHTPTRHGIVIFFRATVVVEFNSIENC